MPRTATLRAAPKPKLILPDLEIENAARALARIEVCGILRFNGLPTRGILTLPLVPIGGKKETQTVKQLIERRMENNGTRLRKAARLMLRNACKQSQEHFAKVCKERKKKTGAARTPSQV